MKKSLGASTIIVPTPVWLVGSYDKDGKANIATIAWGGICSSDPASVAISFRKSRYTYDAIIERKAFTINVPSEKYVREADYAGMASGRNADKFSVAGLTAVRSKIVDAPYVAEFPLVLECRLLQTVDCGVHIQFVGQILDVKADEDVVDASGILDARKVKPLIFSPADSNYYGLGEVVAKGYDVGRDLLK
jgi:flavin reductase (DIM6/NTAB) family NADH-FMN oxidoreductase RutF